MSIEGALFLEYLPNFKKFFSYFKKKKKKKKKKKILKC